MTGTEPIAAFSTAARGGDPTSRLPPFARAVMEALRFRNPQLDPLSRLSNQDWDRAVLFCDRTKLTLPLGLRCDAALPERIRARIASDFQKNAVRWQKTIDAYAEISDALSAAGIEFAVLKGFSQCPHFVRDPRHRTQGDFDLLVPSEHVLRARDVALSLNYEPLEGFDDFPIDHLPRMVRKTGWRWRGDFFDVDTPLSLELHFRLWDAETEKLTPGGVDQFWARREMRRLEGMAFPALDLADSLAYSTLHILRHLLRGDLRASHVYELAEFLHGNASDDLFWARWANLHPASLRRLEAVGFALASRWFDCDLPRVAIEEIEGLPAETSRWLDTSSGAPIEAMFHPNKDEIWLHWSLLDSPRDRWSVLRRRLWPAHVPRFVPDPHVDRKHDWPARARDTLHFSEFLAGRAAKHARGVLSTVRGAVRWFAPEFPNAEYFRFFTAAALFNLGRYIFVLLYNLYLLRAGFRENVLGSVASAMTAGSLAGTWLAAGAIRRAGVRKLLLVAFPAIAGVSMLQASASSAVTLVALAFLAGLFSSAWAVGISPALAERTTERNRPFGFSLLFSSGVGIGIFGGFFGGRLPGWFARGASLAELPSYRAALLLSCGIVLLAMWPLARMQPGTSQPARRKIRRPGPVLTRFLIAIAVWNFGTGAFNPFFNVYFARMGLAVDRIGGLFSIVHLVQASAMLLAPIALRRFGMTRGVSSMQAATALALLFLAVARTPLWGGVAYTFYMTAQYATEPGMYAFLMNISPEDGRPGASALNFIAIFAAQAAGQALSGVLLVRLGYPPVLACAAIICMAAALLFRVLLRNIPEHDRARA